MPTFGFGIKPRGAEDLAELTDDLHGIRGSDDHIEIQVTGLDFGSQVVETDDFGTSGLGGFSLVALGEHGNTHRLAGTGGQDDGTTHDLVGFTCINAEVDSHVDGFVKLGGSSFLGQGQGFLKRVQLLGDYLASEGLLLLAQLCHDYRPSTVMPMERAEPAIVRIAASISAAVRSGILVLAISSH